MADRYISKPLLQIISAAKITPAAVHRSITTRSNKHTYPVLTLGHPYVRRVRAATNLDVIGISWRYGRLLVSVEQMKDRRIYWFYKELKGSHCSFRFPAEIPHTVLGSLAGKSLKVVIDEISPLADVIIAGPDEDYATPGWLCLKLAPEWVSF